jgi:acyl-CoA synthetase (AMP-forming)/AMP-acid ligase II
MSYEDSLKTGERSALLSWRFSEIKGLPDIPKYWATHRPNKVALIEGTASRTYAQLEESSNRMANRLIREGVARGSHIGFFGKNAIEVFEIWFGAAKAGCALAAFNWRCSVDELVGILDDAQTPLVFVGVEFLETMTQVRGCCQRPFMIVPFKPGSEAGGGLGAWLAESPGTVPNIAHAPTDTVLLSYTSGTTGQPKGVMAAAEAFSYSCLCGALEPAMAWRDDDIMLMSMPNFHLAGSWVSVAAFYHGATLSILPAFDPGAFMEVLRRDRPTIAPIVPAAIQILLNMPNVGPADFESLRAVMYFGSPISPELARRAIATFGCEFHQFYGATEAWFLTILRHREHIGDHPARLASCGVPLPMVSIRVADSAGAEVAPGVIGEVLARTPMMFAGYWNKPNATAEASRDGWYHTGDLARRDEDGFLYIVDRAKDMIISGGENIYSTEVELALQKLPGVRMCAVIGMPDEKWGERVVAVIIRDPAIELIEETVIAHCRNLIARYKAPKQVEFLDAFPVTPTGKVKKGTLREQLKKAISGN